MPEIQKLSHKHTAILEFMLANPVMKLGDVAKHFEVSQPWLSCIIHSEAFQAMLQERQDQTFNHTVLPLREKMNLVAHKMLDKVLDADTTSMDVDTAADIGTAMLDRLGFSPKAVAAVPPALEAAVQVQRERLARARALIGVQVGGQSVSVALEVQEDGSVQSLETREDRMGRVQDARALPVPQGADGGTEEGSGV